MTVCSTSWLAHRLSFIFLFDLSLLHTVTGTWSGQLSGIMRPEGQTEKAVWQTGGGSQWGGEAELQGSFSWKLINVTLPSVRVCTGTTGGVFLL